jgi:O-antigen/teichoic acid export membrane protein
MLGTTGQGGWALYLNSAQFLLLFLGMGFPSAIVYLAASGKWSKAKLLSTSIGVSLALILVPAIFLILFHNHPHLEMLLGREIRGQRFLLIVFLIYLLIQILIQINGAFLQSEQLFTKQSIIQLLGSITLLLGNVYLYYSQIYTYPEVFLYAMVVVLISGALQLGVGFYLLWGKLYRTIRWQYSDWSTYKALWPFAKWILFANALQFLNYKADVWLIRWYHSQAELGIYTLAVSLIQLVWLLPNVIHTMVYSIVAAEKNPDIQFDRVHKLQKQMIYYAIAACAFGSTLSFWIIPLWYGEGFREASYLLIILSGGIIPIAGALPISAYFAGKGLMKRNLMGSLIGMVLTLMFGFILIPDFGIVGAAWTSVISYTSTAIFYYYHFYKR